MLVIQIEIHEFETEINHDIKRIISDKERDISYEESILSRLSDEKRKKAFQTIGNSLFCDIFYDNDRENFHKELDSIIQHFEVKGSSVCFEK